MKKIVIIVAVLLASCDCQPRYTVPQKPYIITNKYVLQNRRQRIDNPGKCWYHYISQDGQVEHFVDFDTKYEIGDTIR